LETTAAESRRAPRKRQCQSAAGGVSTHEHGADVARDLLNNHITNITENNTHCTQLRTRAIPKVSSLDVLDNNIFYNLYISETYILYKL